MLEYVVKVLVRGRECEAVQFVDVVREEIDVSRETRYV